ncbi:MAG: oligosaccharide repeat unit polymerase [Bacteroidetes bacterium]|nr:oligosaccharide repeat unit polymerase [Bacteroidota bacterium]
MKRINYYSLLLVVHFLLIFITVFGSIFVIIIGQPEWLIAFITVPMINLLLLPITKKGEKFDPAHPILMILVSVIIGSVLRSFFIISPYESPAKFLMLMGKPPTFLLVGIIPLYIGFIFFVFGYIYPVKPLRDWSRKKIYNEEVSLKKFIPVTIIITLVSMYTAYEFFKKTGVNFAALSADDLSKKRRFQMEGGGYAALGYYKMVMDLIEPLFYIALMYMILNKKKIISFLGALTLFLGILNLIYPVIESIRSNALYVIINTGLIIFYLTGGIKLKDLLKVALVGSVILYGMTIFRSSNNTKRTVTTVSTNPLAIMVGTTNFTGVDKTSQIINGIPDKLPYQFGESLVYWLTSPIPRTWWPDKPAISYGLIIGEKIYGKRDFDDPGGGIPPGYVAEMYLNFGYAGIVLGMFLMGLLFKLFYDAYKKNRATSIYAMLIFVIVFVPLALKLIGGDFSGCMTKVIKGVVSVYIIMKLIQKKQVNNPDLQKKEINQI